MLAMFIPLRTALENPFGALLAQGVLYQFQRTSKVVTFVNGGYSLAFRNDVLNMAYFGREETPLLAEETLGITI